MTARDRARAAEMDDVLPPHQHWIRVRATLGGKLGGIKSGPWIYCRIRGERQLFCAALLDAIKARLGYRAMEWNQVADPEPATLKRLYERDGIEFFMEAHL